MEVDESMEPTENVSYADEVEEVCRKMSSNFTLGIKSCGEEGHPDKMEKWDIDLGDGSSTANQKKADIQESRHQAIQRCIQSLVHACQCRDANCRFPSCEKMKRVVQHTKSCKRKINGGCPICKQLIALCCYHAKHCQGARCLLPFCLSIKLKLRQRQLRLKLQRLLKIRTMIVQNRRLRDSVPRPSPENSNVFSQPPSALALDGVSNTMGNPGTQMEPSESLPACGPMLEALHQLLRVQQSPNTEVTTAAGATDIKI